MFVFQLQILGMWYGIEVIDHHQRDEILEIDPDQCIIFHLTNDGTISTTQSPHYKSYQNKNRYHDEPVQFLKLVWREQDTMLEYTLKFNDSRRGYWMTGGPSPRSSIIDIPNNQFIGTVQVMKAIGNQLVLTFCQTAPDYRLYTVVLARQADSLAPEVIFEIN